MVWWCHERVALVDAMSLPDHLCALRDAALLVTCEDYAESQGWKLARGVSRSGPCPAPGCGGNDRFSINTKMNAFLCRVCGISGSGSIALVEKVSEVSFVEACEIITGRKAQEPIPPEVAAENKRKADAAAAKRELDAKNYREKARRDGFAIWQSRSRDPARLQLLDYLRIRGLLTSDLMAIWPQIRLSQHDALPYRLALKGGAFHHVTTGLAMLAAVQMPDGRFGAVHRTYLDLDQPNGKLLAFHPETKEPVDPKKSMGTKQGGAIRIYTPESPRRIIMGEGIETTATPLAHNFEPDTAYWAGVDVGNMAGRAARDAKGRAIEGEPDLADLDCFQPPDWCEELIYLGETEAAGRNTVAKLSRGLMRAFLAREEARKANPALPPLETVLIEPPPAGDLNDLVKE